MRLIHGDCLDILPTLDAESVDAVITDPPYGLTFMGKKWDADVPAEAIWRECLRVLKPGGHLLCFSGTRTYHRMAVRIEDAGFHIRDMVAWVYGSGFPKSRDISKAIDARGGNPHLTVVIGKAIKAARIARGLTAGWCDKYFCGGTTNWTWFEGRPTGQRAPTVETFARIVEEWPELALFAESVAEIEREVVGAAPWTNSRNHFVPGEDHAQRVQLSVTAPATDAAKQWEGWGTALKPAFEPCCLARKPFKSTVEANVLEHGTGGLNIDGCRIEGIGAEAGRTRHGGGIVGNGSSYELPDSHSEMPAGRWPANFIHDGSDEVVELFPQTTASNSSPRNNGEFQSVAKGRELSHVTYGHEDKGGSAARFFKECLSEPLCDLCDLPIIERLGIMNETQGDELCPTSASIVKTNFSPTTTIKDSGSVVAVVPPKQQPNCADKAEPFNESVNNATKSSKHSQAVKRTSVPLNAQAEQSDRFAQNVKSAASLCDLCATVIVRSIAAIRQGETPESLLGQAFICEHKKQILTKNLAAYVALLGNTDTIPTTESLSLLFGSVFHAIDNFTAKQSEQTESEICQQPRFAYHSKASKEDRDEGLAEFDVQVSREWRTGNEPPNVNHRVPDKETRNNHPTVKPTDLMRYLCRLVTPRGGIILDPFMGSGSTGRGALLEGFDFIGIEQDDGYFEIAKARIAYTRLTMTPSLFAEEAF